MSRYDPLMKQYVAELGEARDKALAWWEGLVARETKSAGSKAEALKQLRLRWQVGPVSHPYVIAVYRKYFLKIEELNEKVDEEEEQEDEEVSPDSETSWGEEDDDEEEEEEDEGTIPPDYLLRLDLNVRDPELHDFMQPLVFQPIGLAPNGETA